MKGYIVVEGVDGFGNDVYVHLDRVYLKREEAIQECIENSEKTIEQWISFYEGDYSLKEIEEELRTLQSNGAILSNEDILEYLSIFAEDGEVEVYVEYPSSSYDFQLSQGEAPGIGRYGFYETEIS